MKSLSQLSQEANMLLRLEHFANEALDAAESCAYDFAAGLSRFDVINDMRNDMRNKVKALKEQRLAIEQEYHSRGGEEVFAGSWKEHLLCDSGIVYKMVMYNEDGTTQIL
jgi:hypothetical protein